MYRGLSFFGVRGKWYTFYMKEKAVVFTDGASRGNPGPGGWGVVALCDGYVIELGGGEGNTTNNRMELKAAIEGVSFLVSQEVTDAIVYTDSSYLINGITKWVHGWRKSGWKTRDGEEVLNQDLWNELSLLADEVRISWTYVRGHAGTKGNERTDEIATAFAGGKHPDLFEGPLSAYSIPDILKVSTIQKSMVSSKKRSNAPAYSYVSSLEGKIVFHKTWAECEARVKGKKGARFKKALTKEEEASIVKEWSK